MQQAVALAKEAHEIAQERVRALAGGGSGGSTPSPLMRTPAHTPAASSPYTRSPARTPSMLSQPTTTSRLYSSSSSALPVGSVRQPGGLSSLMGVLSSSSSAVAAALHDPALSFTRQYRAA
ncbi:hypothetical protein EON66_04895 [archaeon]|nr:MAG: hypothetical protein EON66_04895 [archaeon]